MIEDQSLLKATRREQWRAGCVVEVFGPSRQWCVGWIVGQEHGYLMVHFSNNGQEQTKPIRANDASLQPLGTHIHATPPGWEVRPTGQGRGQILTNRHINRNCTTLEAAWGVSFELQRKVPHHAGRPDMQGKGSPGPAASPAQGQLHCSARSQALNNGEVVPEDLMMRLQEKENELKEFQRIIEAKEEKIHQLLHELSVAEARNANLQKERDEARHDLERFQHGLVQRSASQTSLQTSAQSVVSPGLQPSSSAKCIKSDATGLPPVPNSWQPSPQSAREGKCLSPVSPQGPEEAEEGDQFPGPDFNGFGHSYRAGSPALGAGASAPASRASEKPVDILVTVPRACGPEDLDPSNYEHFHKDYRFHEPSRSLQSLQKNMQPPPPHTVTRLPSAPVNSAFAGQVAFPRPMHPNFTRLVTSASASVPSAPASLAAPAGGVRLAPRPSMVPVQVPMAGYQVR